MQAAVSKSVTLLEAQIEMILHVRSSWQQLDVSIPPVPVVAIVPSAEERAALYSASAETKSERIRFSQSA